MSKYFDQFPLEEDENLLWTPEVSSLILLHTFQLHRSYQHQGEGALLVRVEDEGGCALLQGNIEILSTLEEKGMVFCSLLCYLLYLKDVI